MSNDAKLGISGRISAFFLESQLTPLFAVMGLLLGVFAILITPREEEPQIDVTFANVFISMPGASAREVEQLVTNNAEQVAMGIVGVEHVYSSSQPGLAVLGIRFNVGEKRTDAIVRLYNAFYEHQDWLPPTVNAGPVLIKPKGIDDVPIYTITLSDKNNNGYGDVLRVAHTLETEIKRIDGTFDVYTIGGTDPLIKLELNPQLLSGYGLSLNDLQMALNAINQSTDTGHITQNNADVLVQSGTFLTKYEDVKSLVIGMYQNKPIFLSDVAVLKDIREEPQNYVSHCDVQQSKNIAICSPAVTLAVTKKSGANASTVANRIDAQLARLKNIAIPSNVSMTVTRNYGKSASEKAAKLIEKLVFATSSVILLVLLTLGKREAVIVGSAVLITLAVTLFASWGAGFTLNRVSLFALIFSIGILVDDAIVVVENIHRHRQMGNKSLKDAIPLAVNEVGGPTILATLTVIAALLPMAFVSGLMGPYMSPIPINASMGMLISLAIAFIITPWMAYRFLKNDHHISSQTHIEASRLQRFFRRLMLSFLQKEQGRKYRVKLLVGILVAIFISLGLGVFKFVVLKMLPFDNKSEFQVIVDMPAGTTLENTQKTLQALGVYLKSIPEVSHYQLYAGTASPINFNGLVRQYYLRKQPYQGDIQVNLVDKHHRHRKSHEIALAVREPLQKIGVRYGANVKIVEVPPGPPVLSPLVVEVYGPDYQAQAKTVSHLTKIFQQSEGIVDIDNTIEAPQKKLIIRINSAKAVRLGVNTSHIINDLNLAIKGVDISYLHDEHSKYPIPIRAELSDVNKSNLVVIKNIRIKSQTGQLIALADLADIIEERKEQTIFHKDLMPVGYVTADLAGGTDSPLYGMGNIISKINQQNEMSIEQYYINQPPLPITPSIKWDGEWQITYETFRDMGLAYSVGLILIYLLVVAQFKSYSVPLIIMAPIPLTLIGIMPGHALLGVQFTATSMIGMIALAGIIVRNSILLVDFIRQETARGVLLQEAVINAAAVRAMPIILTGLAAMMGAFFILDDPIFSGLAVSLIFGIFVSTLLTLFVIPIVYYAYNFRKIE